MNQLQNPDSFYFQKPRTSAKFLQNDKDQHFLFIDKFSQYVKNVKLCEFQQSDEEQAQNGVHRLVSLASINNILESNMITLVLQRCDIPQEEVRLGISAKLNKLSDPYSPSKLLTLILYNQPDFDIKNLDLGRAKDLMIFFPQLDDPKLYSEISSKINYFISSRINTLNVRMNSKDDKNPNFLVNLTQEIGVQSELFGNASAAHKHQQVLFKDLLKMFKTNMDQEVYCNVIQIALQLMRVKLSLGYVAGELLQNAIDVVMAYQNEKMTLECIVTTYLIQEQLLRLISSFEISSDEQDRDKRIHGFYEIQVNQINQFEILQNHKQLNLTREHRKSSSLIKFISDKHIGVDPVLHSASNSVDVAVYYKTLMNQLILSKTSDDSVLGNVSLANKFLKKASPGYYNNYQLYSLIKVLNQFKELDINDDDDFLVDLSMFQSAMRNYQFRTVNKHLFHILFNLIQYQDYKHYQIIQLLMYELKFNQCPDLASFPVDTYFIHQSNIFDIKCLNNNRLKIQSFMEEIQLDFEVNISEMLTNYAKQIEIKVQFDYFNKDIKFQNSNNQSNTFNNNYIINISEDTNNQIFNQRYRIVNNVQLKLKLSQIEVNFKLENGTIFDLKYDQLKVPNIILKEAKFIEEFTELPQLHTFRHLYAQVNYSFNQNPKFEYKMSFNLKNKENMICFIYHNSTIIQMNNQSFDLTNFLSKIDNKKDDLIPFKFTLYYLTEDQKEISFDLNYSVYHEGKLINQQNKKSEISKFKIDQSFTIESKLQKSNPCLYQIKIKNNSDEDLLFNSFKLESAHQTIDLQSESYLFKQGSIRIMTIESDNPPKISFDQSQALLMKQLGECAQSIASLQQDYLVTDIMKFRDNNLQQIEKNIPIYFQVVINQNLVKNSKQVIQQVIKRFDRDVNLSIEVGSKFTSDEVYLKNPVKINRSLTESSQTLEIKVEFKPLKAGLISIPFLKINNYQMTKKIYIES